ncbi:hypothetical protein MRX96_019709 [Rhipicephalus microplus]
MKEASVLVAPVDSSLRTVRATVACIRVRRGRDVHRGDGWFGRAHHFKVMEDLITETLGGDSSGFFGGSGGGLSRNSGSSSFSDSSSGSSLLKL